jgi:hypothetical protein
MATKKKVVKAKKPVAKKGGLHKMSVRDLSMLPTPELLGALPAREQTNYTVALSDRLAQREERIAGLLGKLKRAEAARDGLKAGISVRRERLDEGLTPADALDKMPTDELVLYARKLPSLNAIEALCVRLEVMEGKLDELHAKGARAAGELPMTPVPTAANLAESVEGSTYEEITESFIAAMDSAPGTKEEYRSGMRDALESVQMSIDAISEDIAGDSGNDEADAVGGEKGGAGDAVEDEKE